MQSIYIYAVVHARTAATRSRSTNLASWSKLASTAGTATAVVVVVVVVDGGGGGGGGATAVLSRISRR